jgi:hypothetical protein
MHCGNERLKYCYKTDKYISSLISQCIEQVLYYHSTLNKSFIITIHKSFIITVHKSFIITVHKSYHHSALKKSLLSQCIEKSPLLSQYIEVLYYHNTLNKSFIITVHWTSPLLSQKMLLRCIYICSLFMFYY